MGRPWLPGGTLVPALVNNMGLGVCVNSCDTTADRYRHHGDIKETPRPLKSSLNQPLGAGSFTAALGALCSEQTGISSLGVHHQCDGFMRRGQRPGPSSRSWRLVSPLRRRFPSPATSTPTSPAP